jgi:hypothetical protein
MKKDRRNLSIRKGLDKDTPHGREHKYCSALGTKDDIADV